MSTFPPGPRGSVIQTLAYAMDPYGYHARCTRRYGSTYTLPTVHGKLVLTGDPAGAKEIFAADPALFQPWQADALAPVLGRRSLIIVGGEHHTMDRRLMMPAFHGPRMRAYADVMAEAVRNHAPARADGQVFALNSLTERVSLEIILRAVFGVRGAARMGQFNDAILAYVAAIHPAIIFLPAIRRQFFGHGPWARLLAAQERFDALMYEEIAAHKRMGDEAQDVLSLLLQARYEDGTPMSDSEVHDEMITLVIAGHETTATAVAWCIYDLLRAPSTLRTLLAELDAVGPAATPEDLTALPYLSAVCNETLRLHPVVPDVTRELRAPFELRGYHLPKGTAVGVSAVIMHHDPNLYPKPHEFIPERFVGKKPSPFEFIPFGGGARRCIGAAFAQQEMKIVVATLVREYELSLASTATVKPERRNLTVGPKGGVRVRMRRRACPVRSATTVPEGARTEAVSQP